MPAFCLKSMKCHRLKTNVLGAVMKGVFIREQGVLANHFDPWVQCAVHSVQYSVQCNPQCSRVMWGIHALTGC